jgi:hypothetical protein
VSRQELLGRLNHVTQAIKSLACRYTIVVLLFALPVYTFANENHCDDPQAAHDWDALAQRYEGHVAVVYLYRLRQRICAAIANGTMTLDDGIERFDAARQRIIKSKQERLNHQVPALGIG